MLAEYEYLQCALRVVTISIHHDHVFLLEMPQTPADIIRFTLPDVLMTD